MAFPILGAPRPQFFDSSGSPLVSGTLSVLNPANDTNKASYPTYDDAEAATNANANPIVLNARGECSLWGLDNEDYKLVLKDAVGATIWTSDDVFLPVRSNTLYNKTAQTLTDAGAVTLTESTTFLVTTGAAAITLADGAENQYKHIVMKTDAGAATLTPTNLSNGTIIIFDDVGDSAHLIFIDGSWNVIGGSATVTGYTADTTVTFTSADATPTVAGGTSFITAGTTAITDFDDGVVGQTIKILGASSITITDSAAIALKGSTNFDMVAGDTLTLHMFNDQVWEEVGRSVTANSTGVFSPTPTGVTTPSGTMSYAINGSLCTLWATILVGGNSDSTSFTVTGIPTAARPVNAKIMITHVANTGITNIFPALVTIGTDGILTFSINSPFSTTGFANDTNIKGLQSGWSITYGLN